MRSFWYPRGYQILHVDQVLHANCGGRAHRALLAGTPGRDANSRHAGISGNRLPWGGYYDRAGFP